MHRHVTEDNGVVYAKLALCVAGAGLALAPLVLIRWKT